MYTMSVLTRGRAVAARKAHNLEVAGSNPAPATKVLLTIRLLAGIWFLLEHERGCAPPSVARRGSSVG